MMNLDLSHLKLKPFYLSDADVSWVDETIGKMTDEEKVAQLFCLIAYSSDEDYLTKLAKNDKVGGVMCRPMSYEETIKTNSILQANSDIPMLIAANLERGGVGIIEEGTSLGSMMAVGATDNDEMASNLGTVCGKEGYAVGCNWSFAPVIDIDYNWRNPITNVRTFGSNPERVKRMGVNYVEALQKEGVAASIKHFPGDGVDERDQHLVTSINSMDVKTWDETFGEVYRASIDAGAMSIMIGHISMPEYSRKLKPGIKDEDILPATLADEITTTLLKEQLGFNGLVVTDATTMAGMTIPMHRSKSVPLSIAAGCDMFLFAKDMDEDFEYMRKGIEDGIITQERLHDALSKILGMKAALKLHEKQKDGTLMPEVNLEDMLKSHEAWAKECADCAITLVKEEAGVMPITPDRYKRILIYPHEASEGFAYTVRVGAANSLAEKLKEEGFIVEIFEPKPGFEGMMQSVASIEDHYDLLLHVANFATKSNQTTVRIEWAIPMGTNVPIYMESIPTVFVSLENPYHLIDVPRVKTFINTYASNEVTLDALVCKLTGNSEFKGKNPIDPFLGMWDTRL